MANYICNPFTPLPVSLKSHTRGWSEYWARSLDAEILTKDFRWVTNKDTLYIDHGVNFGGTLNLFGGVDEGMVQRIEHLINVEPKVFSLDIEMPDYQYMLGKRVGQATCHPKLQGLLGGMHHFLEGAPTFDYQGVANKTKWLSEGDSHSTAFAREKAGINRTNGKLLHTFLKEPIKHYDKKLKGITFTFGSIDIRHHVYRQLDPLAEVTRLATGLVQRAKQIEKETGILVELSYAVPIEWEGRAVPKTGYYKGSPFYGNVEMRQKLTKRFNKVLSDNHGSLVRPPEGWYTMDPEAYAKNIMELGGSVHISPMHYRSVSHIWRD